MRFHLLPFAMGGPALSAGPAGTGRRAAGLRAADLSLGLAAPGSPRPAGGPLPLRGVRAAPHAQEPSVAQTRPFTSMMLLAARLIDGGHAAQAHSALPAAARALLDQYGELAEAGGRALQLARFFFLGSGGR